MSIRWQLFKYLALLVVALLVILWLFQVVFMERFYKSIKKGELLDIGHTIEKNFCSDNITSIMGNLALSRDVCIVITDMNGDVSYTTLNNLSQHPILKFSQYDYMYLGSLAEKAGGEIIYWEEENRGPFVNIAPNDILKKKRNGNAILTKIIEGNGYKYIVMISSHMVPVEATVSTIRKQLIYVTIIMLIIAFLLALFIADKVTKPIISINKKSKKLANIDREQVRFEDKQYKEISELSDTLNYVSEELVKTENLKRELIANVSHDLRTPLTLISGYAEMMRDLPGENNPANNQVIIDEATRLTALVNDMLDLSKLQANNAVLNIQEYNFTHSVQNILNRYTTFMENDGYEIIFEYDREVIIDADELKMSQVMYNLINNAINYTGSDKKVAIIQGMTHNNMVHVEIVDHGEGIPEDALPYIWDRYYKVDKTHKRAKVGTGIGLSIVRNILEAHNLNYGVSSKVGEGSTFWFEIPIVKK